MVVAVVVSVLAGVVVERLGARLCLIIGTCVLCLTWIMIGQATDFWVLLLARVIQGVVGEPLGILPYLSNPSLEEHCKQISGIKSSVTYSSYY